MTSPILTIVGARPNFMKAAPIHRAFEAKGVPHEIIHTGQHYDAAMSKVFFDDLGMPEPTEYLGVGSGSHAVQTANIMIGLERVFVSKKPRMVLVVGDVNSTMAAALVASKLQIPVGHVEAGLRSRDWTMPEEVNRMVTDSVSDLLLTPSPDADANLVAEGKPKSSIVRVGNVMIDTLLSNIERAKAIDVPSAIGVEGAFAVLTLHRPSNVDSKEIFEPILGALLEIQKQIAIVFPVHPRTRQHIESWGLTDRIKNAANMHLIDPLGYLEFMSLMHRATLILTDSGGLQEESTALGIPCLTIRENTERPITVEQGTNILVGTDPGKILKEASRVLSGHGKKGVIPDLWDGQTAVRIAEAVLAFLHARPDR